VYIHEILVSKSVDCKIINLFVYCELNIKLSVYLCNWSRVLMF